MSTHAQALDLSGGGMLVKGLEAPHLDDEFRFEIELGDGGAPVAGRGRVVRLETADRVGLQFCDLEQSECVRIQHIAFEMSRQQRRRFG